MTTQLQTRLDIILESNGKNRIPKQHCQINAKNDYQAVNLWLSEYQDRKNTFKAYQKEVERFLMWAALERKKALSNLDRQDFAAYFEFIQDPQPTERWCNSKPGRRPRKGEPGWRPFSGPLSRSAQQAAIAILNSMMTYLVDAQYLQFNPLKLMKFKLKRDQQTDRKLSVMARILEPDEWQAMQQTLAEWPDMTEKEKLEKTRLLFIVGSLFFLGLRVHELVQHQWQHIRKWEGRWWFMVTGKGNKLAMIPVNSHLIKAMVDYRLAQSLPAYPLEGETRPLICTLKGEKKVSEQCIRKLLRELALKTAESFSDKPSKQQKLKHFSPHWLRHLSATLQDRIGVPFGQIRENMRHSTDDTTRLYVHQHDVDRHQSLEQLTWFDAS